MTPLAWHSLFDLLAWASALAMGFVVSRWRGDLLPPRPSQAGWHLPILVFGSALGAYVFGTLNLWASGMEGIARSIEGAIVGGILSVETYKLASGLSGRTGARLAAPLAIGIAVGRIGCFLGGLDDFTYGVETSLPWGVDFGDGVSRHPVQLYESATMALFLIGYLALLARRNAFVAVNGFTLAVGFYGLQRLGWEQLKPYGAVLGPVTVFDGASVALVIYAGVLLARSHTLPLAGRVGRARP